MHRNAPARFTIRGTEIGDLLAAPGQPTGDVEWPHIRHVFAFRNCFAS
jgi:hypothetical protein